MSVDAVRDFLLLFLLLVGVEFVFISCFQRRFKVHIVSHRLSLLSLVGLFCGPRSRKMDGWLSLFLRCIVVKATQVLESSLVAELVFILGERRKDKVRNPTCHEQAFSYSRYSRKVYFTTTETSGVGLWVIFEKLEPQMCITSREYGNMEIFLEIMKLI